MVKPSSPSPCHSCKKKMNLVSQDFSICMSRTPDPPASVLSKAVLLQPMLKLALDCGAAYESLVAE